MKTGSARSTKTIPTETHSKSFQIVQTISDSDYPVYKVTNKDNTQFFALKVYPYRDGKINKYFANEVRFMSRSLINEF